MTDFDPDFDPDSLEPLSFAKLREVTGRTASILHRPGVRIDLAFWAIQGIQARAQFIQHGTTDWLYIDPTTTPSARRARSVDGEDLVRARLTGTQLQSGPEVLLESRLEPSGDWQKEGLGVLCLSSDGWEVCPPGDVPRSAAFERPQSFRFHLGGLFARHLGLP